MIHRGLPLALIKGKDEACKLTPTPLSVVIAHEMGHAMGENDDGPGHMNNVKNMRTLSAKKWESLQG